MNAHLMAWRSWESVWPMHWCKAYIDREPKLGRSNMQAGEKAHSKFWLSKWFAGNIRDHFYSEFWLELIMLQSVNSIAATPWIAACQAFLSVTNSRSLLKLMSIELVMPSSHLILCHLFSNESNLRMTWPKYWSFSFSISPSNEHTGMISFRMDWLDLLAVQGTLKSLLQHHSSKASILWCSAFFTVQLSHP